MLQHLSKRKGDYAGAFRRLPKKLQELFIQAYQSYLFNRFLSQRKKEGVSLNEPKKGDYLVYIDDKGLPTGNFTQLTSLVNVKEDLEKDKIQLAIPLIGFRQGLSSGIQGEIEHEILTTEQVTPQNFLVSCMPELRAQGELRPTIAKITGFYASNASEDSVNVARQKVVMSFMLNRSSYATVLLREFMKPRNLIKAGY